MAKLSSWLLHSISSLKVSSVSCSPKLPQRYINGTNSTRSRQQRLIILACWIQSQGLESSTADITQSESAQCSFGCCRTISRTELIALDHCRWPRAADPCFCDERWSFDCDRVPSGCFISFSILRRAPTTELCQPGIRSTSGEYRFQPRETIVPARPCGCQSCSAIYNMIENEE